MMIILNDKDRRKALSHTSSADVSKTNYQDSAGLEV